MPKRFLISRLSALGDVVHTLPCASALKMGFPDCHISWVVDPRFAGIVQRCGSVDEVIVRKPGLKPASWRVPGNFDVAFDLQGLLKSGIVVGACRAKKKLGYHWQREGSWLFSHAVVPAPSSQHVVQQYLDVVRSVGGVANEPQFALAPSDEDLDSIRLKLNDIGIRSGEIFVVMNAGAGWASKRWPPPYFADLTHRASAPTVFVGSNSEADNHAFEAVVASGAKGALSLLGKTSVSELVALISLSAAHVGGDTGSSHIAAALGIPAISMFSVTHPDRSCPFGQRDRCHYDPKGLDKILPEHVWVSLQRALEGSV